MKRVAVLSVLASAFQKPRRAIGTEPFSPKIAAVALGALTFIALFVIMKLRLDLWSITEARQLPPWVVDLSGQISAYGKSGWILWPSVGLLAACAVAGLAAKGQLDRLIFSALSLRLIFIFSAVALPGLLASSLKAVIGRARPYLTGQPDASLYVPFAYFRERLLGGAPSPEYAYGSMPSGHAATAVATAIALSALWPRLSPLFWTFAFVICATRVIIAVHHPTDVMVGMVIGGLGALAIRNYFAARRWVFAVDAAGCVNAMPGPSLRRIARAVASLGWQR